VALRRWTLIETVPALWGSLEYTTQAKQPEPNFRTLCGCTKANGT
jgi:hypothetical protein